MRLNPESLARASSRHPWRVIGIWVVLFLAMGALTGTLLGGVLNNDISFTNRPESVKAQEVIDDTFTASEAGESTEYVIVHSDTLNVDDPEFQAYVQQVQAALAAETEFLAAPPTTTYDLQEAAPEQAAGMVSADGTYTLIAVPVAEIDDATVERLREVLDENDAEGFTTQLAGQATLNADFTRIAEEDARKGESIGIMVALIVLVVVFGAIVAALVPIGIAIVSIVIALGITALIGQLVEFNLFVTNIISMIGLAVGIDYSLFIVSRFREERKKGYEKLDAIGAAGATANRAVFFSGMTVVLALLGMFIIPTTIFRALAAGAIFVTLVSIVSSMTLLPAILAKLGDRINWPRLSKRARLDTPHDVPGGVWDRLTRSVMARPWAYLIVSVAIMGGLASFYFQLNKGSSTDIDQLPDVPAKAAFLTLEREFAGGLADPVEIIVVGDVGSDSAQAAIVTLQEEVAEIPTLSPQMQVIPAEDGSAIRISTFLQGQTQNDAAFSTIEQLRADAVPAAFGDVADVEVFVGGNTAFFYDFLGVADSYQWIVLAFVLGLSFLLLLVVFRSLVLPIKAILMNLLSVGAAYGAVTLVFQKGVGIEFFNAIGFNFHQSEAIEAWLPLFLFSILFGLSMDYHVFLLTRIREEYDKTHDNTEAVAYGLRTTAGIITGAAIIMVVVFTGFASGRLGPLQQMGFGLAVAVLLDATIVRTLLVPSGMRLLGDWNWYLPKWLEWLPQLNVEGHEPTREEDVIIPEEELVGDSRVGAEVGRASDDR
ncbi:MAG TPA: MMPL family transporter [Actinomycetota bacterium]|jgi:RND superfamily putative drug exporter